MHLILFEIPRPQRSVMIVEPDASSNFLALTLTYNTDHCSAIVSLKSVRMRFDYVSTSILELGNDAVLLLTDISSADPTLEVRSFAFSTPQL